MSRLGSYKNTAFNESQKFLVLDPSTSSASLVLASELVAYITPQIGSVKAESTRLSAENTDYKVGEIIQTSGATVVGSLASIYLVVTGGAGDFPMLNGNDLLVLSGDDALRAQLISQTAGQGASLVSMEGGPTVEAAVTDAEAEILNRVIRVSSRAEMKAYSLPSGYQFSLAEGGRSGLFVFNNSDLSTEVTGDSLEGKYVAPDSDPTGANGAFVRTDDQELNLYHFGAISGGNGALNSAAISALQAFTGEIKIPWTLAGFELASTLTLTDDQSLTGPGKYAAGLYGNITDPLVRLGNDTDTSDRRNSIKFLHITNNGGNAVSIVNSPDWSIDGCWIEALFAGAVAVYAQMAFRPYMNDTRLAVSGVDSWCLRCLDNVNGGVFSGVQASGGAGGGVADIGRCYNLHFDSWVMESTKYGMRFGTSTDPLSGICNGIMLTNTNWEQCEEPLRVGDNFIVRGFVMDGGFISNASTSNIPGRDASIKLGRVEGGYIKGVSVDLETSEFLFNFYRDAAVGSVNNLQNFDIGYFAFLNTGAGLYKTSGDFLAVPARLNRILEGENTIRLPQVFAKIGEPQVFETGIISTNADTAIKEFDTTTAFGGYVDSIEIIEVAGTLSGSVQIGTSVSVSELLNFDLATESSTRGRQELATDELMRVSEYFTWRVTGTTATSGTFRLRVTYRR
jgi:hypothetical protein